MVLERNRTTNHWLDCNKRIMNMKKILSFGFIALAFLCLGANVGSLKKTRDGHLVAQGRDGGAIEILQGNSWQPVTLTYTNGGTTSVNAAFYRRVGDTMELRGAIAFTGAGTGSSVFFTVPFGLTIDTAKLPDGATMTGSFVGSVGTGAHYDGSTNNALMLGLNTNQAIAFGQHGLAGFLTSVANAHRITFIASMPILEWR